MAGSTPVKITAVVAPPLHNTWFETGFTDKVGHTLNSSAPISGVVTFLTSPSISAVIPAIGVAVPSSGAFAATLLKCKLVAERKTGGTLIEFASFPVAVCHAARFARFDPR